MENLAGPMSSCSREKRRLASEAIRSTPIYHRSEKERGSKILTTTGGFGVEEGDVKTRPVTSATAANLASLVGEEVSAFSVHFEGWRSSKRGKRGFGFCGECAAPKYGGDISWAVSEFAPPLFHRSALAPSIDMREHHILDFWRDKSGSLETADMSVLPRPSPCVL
jgi:hypothetical protein